MYVYIYLVCICYIHMYIYICIYIYMYIYIYISLFGHDQALGDRGNDFRAHPPQRSQQVPPHSSYRGTSLIRNSPPPSGITLGP